MTIIATSVTAVSVTPNVELSQKSKNLNELYTTKYSTSTYWQYFEDTTLYPSYVYLDNYYHPKDLIPIINDTNSFFRTIIAPSLIGMADKIYNDKAVKDQSQERAKELLMDLVKRKNNEWLQYSWIDTYTEWSEKLLSSFEIYITNDKNEYEKCFKSNSKLLKDALKQAEIEINKKIAFGEKPTIGSIYDTEAMIKLKLNKDSLFGKLQEVMNKFDGERYKKLEKLTGHIGMVLNVTSFIRDRTEHFQDMCDLLEADNNFGELLEYIKSNSDTTEVKNAAGELLEQYYAELTNRANMIVKAYENGAYSLVETYIKGLSSEAALAAFVTDLAFSDHVDFTRYITISGNFIYYQDIEHNNLFKISVDGTNKTKLTDERISDNYIKDNWLYYINMSDNF